MTERSVRMLQGRIKAHGTSFNALLGETRFAIAKSQLCNSTTTTTGIAARLGYTDSAHFIRVFRRWSGMAPGEYRNNYADSEAIGIR